MNPSGFKATRTIIILIAIVIGVAGTTIYFTSNQPPSVQDWITDGVKAGCMASTKNNYGIPESFICPVGVIENITIEKI